MRTGLANWWRGSQGGAPRGVGLHMAGCRTPEPVSRRSILVVRTDRLGETLLTLPAIHALRHAFPHARLTLMLHPALQELFAGHPDVDEVVPEPAGAGPWWRHAWRVSRLWRSWHPEIIILANPKKAYHLGAWLAGIPRRVGYDRKWGWLLTHRLQDRKPLGERHEVEYNLELIRTLGIAACPAPPPWLPVSPQEASHLLQRLEQLGVPVSNRLIAVHPWTSNPRKQWPVDRFRALVQRLAQEAGLAVVVIGGRGEQAQAAEVLAGGRETPRVLNLVGRCSLRELAALLQRARVVVSNDSGPIHVAAAVGTPVVALFGTGEAGSHPRRWGPWGEGHTVIHKPLEAITVDEVVVAVARYL